ncbi:uncharacterized protein AB9X84_000506 isoform 1-T1 [Acanthopagrus schlegelii]
MPTPVPTRKLLKEYLDDLNEERLKELQWYLVQIQTDGSRPIPNSKLENATRVETVNKLVEAFGEDGAVEWTVDTFFRMNLNDLASKLVQAKENQSLEQREDESGTSSAREKPREVDPNILKDLSCSICLSLFTDPVMLQCGHSFCQTCVHKDWEKNIVRECSLCKQVIPESDPPINFSLKSLCESYGGRSQGEPPVGHRNHTESFQTPPKNIRETQESLKNVKQLCDSSVEHIKTQSFNTENKIMDEFKKLHAFLDEEEKTRRAALRKEARQKICVIHLMHEKIKKTYSLSHTMGETEDFGDNERLISTRVTEVLRREMELLNILKSSQGQINVPKHLEKLQLKVWKKMGNDIKQTGADSGDEDDDSGGLNEVVHQMNDRWQFFPGNQEHNPHYQQNQQKTLKRRRVEQDYEDGKVSFLDHDYFTSILTHDGTFTQSPVFPCVDYSLMRLPFEIPYNIMPRPPFKFCDEVEAEVQVENEDEQGRAETLREILESEEGRGSDNDTESRRVDMVADPGEGTNF